MAQSREFDDEIIAWAEHCRRIDPSGQLFEKSAPQHLRDVYGVKQTWSNVEKRVKVMASRAATPLCHVPYSYLYKNYGAEGLTNCVVIDRGARKVLGRRLHELSQNSKSKPLGSAFTVISSGRKQSSRRIGRLDGLRTPKAETVKKRKPRRRRGRNRSGAQVCENSLSPIIARIDARSQVENRDEVVETPSPEHYRVSRQLSVSESIDNETFCSTMTSPRDSAESSETCPLASEIVRFEAVVSNPDTLPYQEEKSWVQTSSDCMFSGEYIDWSEVTNKMQPTKSHSNSLYLWQLLREEQQRCKVLESKLHGYKSAAVMLENHNLQDAYNQILRSEQELEICKSKAQDRDHVKIFMNDSRSGHRSTDIASLSGFMDSMHREMKDIMLSTSSAMIEMPHVLVNANQELRTLCEIVCKGEASHEMSVSCCHLFRALLTAAICQWVFECTWQDDYLNTCIFADTLLWQIALLDGEDYAKTIWYSTLHEIVTSKAFQLQVIPQRARDLTDAFQKLLKSNLDALCPGALKADEFLELLEAEEERLLFIFKYALKIKAHTLTCDNLFESNILPLSTELQYDSTRMNLEGPQCWEGQTCKIWLCLAPGLRIYTSQQKLADWNNFQRGAKVDLEQGSLITPPLWLASAT